METCIYKSSNVCIFQYFSPYVQFSQWEVRILLLEILPYNLAYILIKVMILCVTKSFHVSSYTVTLDVYTVDHQSCQLVVTREAAAKDIQYHVMKELGLQSSNYQLCEVKSSGGMINCCV